MARKPSALADLDITSEGLAHQDGLAERIAKQRGQSPASSANSGHAAEPQAATRTSPPVRDANAWRRGKGLVQVAIPEDAHIELSIIAKRRRIALSQLVKSALNEWLTSHGYPLQIPK